MNFQQDFRYALRGFAKAPGFTAIVVLTLAFAIGANTAVFSVVSAVLLQPLPFRDADRLLVVWQANKQDRSAPPFFDSYNDFQDIQRQSKLLDQVAVATWAVAGKIFSGQGSSREVLAMPVTLEFFSLLGRTPELGRVFQRSDLALGCTAVLKNSFWRSALNRSPKIVGRQIRLDDETCTVIGVMPPDVTFFPDAISMWTLITPLSPIERNPDRGSVGVFAHLRSGVTLASAQSELEHIYGNAHRNDRAGSERIPVALPLQEQFSYLTAPDLRLSLIVLFTAVSFVLLIACLNIANLLLVRFESRYRELAVRSALGSGRLRLIQQLLTESLLLAIAGSLIGLGLAALVIRAFNAANPVKMPPGNPVIIHFRVLLYTSSLAILTTILFGLLPAWRASRVDIGEALKAAVQNASRSSFSRQGVTRVLVTIEIAFSLVLSIGAGLLISSVDRLTSVPLGFSPQGIMSFDVSLPGWKYKTSADRGSFYSRLLTKARESTAPYGVALASSLPVGGGRYGGHELAIRGRSIRDGAHAERDVAAIQITPNYFHMMGVNLLTGRAFTDDDRAASTPVVIVNQALARKYFSSASPINALIRLPDMDAPDKWWTIVGIVADEKESDFFHAMSWRDVPSVFRPIDQDPPGSLALIARAREYGPDYGTTLRREIVSLDPQMPAGEIERMPDRLAQLFAYPRFRAVLLGVFAMLALLLASIGLYGVLAQLVGQRRREIGIRIALGAQREQVVRLIVNQSVSLVLIGIAMGLGLSFVLSRFLTSLLYGVTYSDPRNLAVVTLTLIGVAVFASYLPARRAASVDPALVLRHE